MKLSVALRLGSLLVAKPESGDVRACAVSMANLATNGYQSMNPSDNRAYFICGETYPWLLQTSSSCPKCNKTIYAYELLWHGFDFHVMEDHSMTIEQLADWIASIEPQEPEACTENEQTEAIEVFV